ncbi:MAG TPA: M20/M25/M40 family metallo-hydrolase, partial [Solirubrobacteraceae bacterium]|nr:M20/M25/M40 family metallo-hydrolase [Solirubrobacteraceae bacterium]
AGLLQDASFDVRLVGRTAERPNLVARLRGAREGPVLALISHVDTVLADPAEWRRDPWSGEVVDGFLWGRGAVDMKSQTAAEVVAALSLARDGWRPARGDLLIVATADEETGGGEGAVWLCEHHPDLVRCDELLNEGGGAVLPYGDERLHGVCVAEKGVFRFTLTAEGVAGHASMPGLGDNALLKLAPLLTRLREQPVAWAVTEAPRTLLAQLGLDAGDDPGAAVAALRERDPRLAVPVEAMLGVTMAPTRAFASEKINVIPSRAQLKVDCRTPPGMGRDEAERHIRAALGELDGVALTFDEEVVGNGSPADTPLMRFISGWLDEHDPGSRAVPYVLPAFTDSRTFRAAFPECVAYGFFPHRHMTVHETNALMHAKDERIDVRDLGFAAAFFRDVIRDRLGA